MSFDLKSISQGKSTLPPRIGIYGPEGIGKSTFGSLAPSPIFIPTEDGLGALEVDRFPLAKTYSDVMSAISTLYSDKHKYQTAVIDTMDWLEDLINKHVCKEANMDNIEAFGYGKGYIHAADRMREILDGLNALRLERNMTILCIAHSQVKRFDDPASEPYDRYQLKLHTKSASILIEWLDILGFANQQIIVRKEDVGFNQKAKRGVEVGEHILHLKRSPAFDAKNRYSLPERLPLDFTALQQALQGE
jgi:hypothetical protein